MILPTKFEKNKNVKVYAKLPDWFKIDTSLGKYNPDWANFFKLTAKKNYFVVESKGTLGYEFLRHSEKGKIDCGKKHFEELAKGTDYKMPRAYVTNNEEFVD